jgi:16S rRNA (adenine1518-N6/adenine1519-N6)-dimethyltransferase
MSDLHAKKSLGQNFLVNPGVVAKIVEAAELTPEDTVLEVGPGTGNLTRALVPTGARIIAVEKDHRAIEDLNAEFSAAQIEIIEGDILEFNPEKQGLIEGEYKIVANLPYYITSHFIRTVFEEWPQPSDMIIMVQKEVAKRIMAAPPDMNLLALSVQYYAEPEIIMHVSRGSFRPIPDVDSSVVRLTPRTEYALSAEKEELFFALIKAAFSGKRKQLLNTLPKVTGKNKGALITALENADINPQARPETLDIADWIRLLDTV